MKGYKAFSKDLKCRGMQYEIGKEYSLKGPVMICERGFHFCKTIADCYNYYPKNFDTRICLIEATGDIVSENNKLCTNKIKILKEIKKPWKKTNVSLNNKGICNSGKINTGNCNSGHYNRGHYNTGSLNDGSLNTGDSNIGNSNTGGNNIGYRNSGDCNSGIFNVGNYNIGEMFGL